jgi:SulP family sulfate permease
MALHSKAATAGKGGALVAEDRADDALEDREAYRKDDAQPKGVADYRLSGAVFFASAASLSLALDRVLAGQRTLVLDLGAVTVIDSTGAQTIAGFARDAERRGIEVLIAGAVPEVSMRLGAAGLSEDSARTFPTLQAALDKIR